MKRSSCLSTSASGESAGSDHDVQADPELGMARAELPRPLRLRVASTIMLALVTIPFWCASMTPRLIAVARPEVIGVDDQVLHRAGSTGATWSSHSPIPSRRSVSQPESPFAAADTLQTSRLASRA